MTSDCSKAQYKIKIDDDLVLNTFNLVRFLNDENKFYPEVNFSSPVRKTFFGEIFSMHPIKDKNSKWYATDNEYNKALYDLDYYSNYCNGPAVVMTSDLIQRLFEKSFDIKSILIFKVRLLNQIFNFLCLLFF